MLQYVIFPVLVLLVAGLLVRRFLSLLRRMASSPEALTVLVSAAAMLAGGTYVFHRVEGWGLLDALYFCVISLTTVGYGDLTPQTDTGKAMAIVYILLGLGIVMALVTTLAQLAIEDTKSRGGRLAAALGHKPRD